MFKGPNCSTTGAELLRCEMSEATVEPLHVLEESYVFGLPRNVPWARSFRSTNCLADVSEDHGDVRSTTGRFATDRNTGIVAPKRIHQRPQHQGRNKNGPFSRDRRSMRNGGPNTTHGSKP